MNHLAHALLAGPDPLQRVGNVTGDFIKGPLLPLALLPGIREGVEQHRSIDRFTDDHPLTLEMRRLFAPPYRRYAGILLDVAFDHFLIRHWQAFAPMERHVFVNETYGLLITHRHELPASLAAAAPRLVAHDWLSRCASWEGVDSTLRGLAGRLQHDNPLALAAVEVARNAEPIEQGFLAFFPALMAFAQERTQTP